MSSLNRRHQAAALLRAAAKLRLEREAARQGAAPVGHVTLVEVGSNDPATADIYGAGTLAPDAGSMPLQSPVNGDAVARTGS